MDYLFQELAAIEICFLLYYELEDLTGISYCSQISYLIVEINLPARASQRVQMKCFKHWNQIYLHSETKTIYPMIIYILQEFCTRIVKKYVKHMMERAARVSELMMRE